MLYRDGRLVTTAGVAERNGRFFLARRKRGGALSLKWEFPGGKCAQPRESEHSCLQREFSEEFGVHISVGPELGSVPFRHREQDYLLVAYAITFHDEPGELHVHVDAGWFLPEEVRGLDLADSDRALLGRMWAPEG